jgi:peroxiredoxin
LGLSVLPSYGGPIKSGNTLPSFQATLADGTEINEAYFQNGKTTALIFFQGRWCPFCMTHLRELEDHHNVFDKVKARPVVVSIEDVETAGRTQRDFPHLTVISDKRRELADAVDVINKGFGPDGQDSAAPTILLLDGEGKVLWIHRPTRFITRPSASDLAAEIEKHQKV